MANSAALVTDAFPRRELGKRARDQRHGRRGRADPRPDPRRLADGFGWQTVFWFNVPIGIVGTIAAACLLVEQGATRSAAGPRRRRQRASTSIGLSGLVTALAFGGIYGWTTPWVIGGFAAFVVAAPAFLWVEAHQPDAAPRPRPVPQPAVRARQPDRAAQRRGTERGPVPPRVLPAGARGYDPVTAGLMLAPLAIGLLVLSPISGALADRYGSRVWPPPGWSSRPSACSG